MPIKVQTRSTHPSRHPPKMNQANQACDLPWKCVGILGATALAVMASPVRSCMRILSLLLAFLAKPYLLLAAAAPRGGEARDPHPRRETNPKHHPQQG